MSRRAKVGNLETKGRRNWAMARSSPGVASSAQRVNGSRREICRCDDDDDAEEASFSVQQGSKPNWR